MHTVKSYFDARIVKRHPKSIDTMEYQTCNEKSSVWIDLVDIEGGPNSNIVNSTLSFPCVSPTDLHLWTMDTTDPVTSIVEYAIEVVDPTVV